MGVGVDYFSNLRCVPLLALSEVEGWAYGKISSKFKD